MIQIPPLDLELIWTIFIAQERQGTYYEYGVKAPGLNVAPNKIASIDCSGEFRYLLYQGSGGRLTVPDGSQAQREWLENSGARKIAKYSDVVYATINRLFACCIQPGVNGCGSVGHIFMCSKLTPGTITHTIESHGGGGCTSRPWNTPVLVRETCEVFELPTLGNRR